MLSKCICFKILLSSFRRTQSRWTPWNNKRRHLLVSLTKTVKHVHCALHLRTTTCTVAVVIRLCFPSVYQNQLFTHPIVNSLWVKWLTVFVAFSFQCLLLSWISCIGTCWLRNKRHVHWVILIAVWLNEDFSFVVGWDTVSFFSTWNYCSVWASVCIL